MSGIYQALAEIERTGKPAVLVTVVEKRGSGPAMPGAKMIVYPDGTIQGTVGGGAIEKAAIAEALRRLPNRKNGLITYNLDDEERLVDATETGMVCGGSTVLYYECLGAPVHLLVFGGGHIGRELARFGTRLGYAVTIADTRKEILDGLSHPSSILLPSYHQALESLTLPEHGTVVIATHSHAFDESVLTQVLAAGVPLSYIGVVASRKKAEQIVRTIREKLGDVDLDTLHMPVGLAIGGPTPAEIALSILAEIQAVRYSKTGHAHMGPSWST